MRHKGLDFLQSHALLNGTLHADQPHAELVFAQLAHGTNTTIAQMVDIIAIF